MATAAVLPEASGWTAADHTAEIADLWRPGGDLTLPTGSFPVVSLWSNAASACVVSGQPFAGQP